MGTLIERPLAFALRHSKRILKANPTTRRLMYDLVNAHGFADLKEHESMLADTTRVDSYYEGIRRFVKPGNVVVDLGTGSGILTFFAARQGARVVYAIDHSDIIELAKQIAAQNKITNVEFVKSHSQQFTTDLPVDVIIQEQMGDSLFNERMIENTLDLKRRLLKPGGRILPGKYELYLEPVSMVPEFSLPHIWSHTIHGIDFRSLEGDGSITKYRGGDYERREVSGRMVERLLGTPEPILAFDLNELTEEPQFPNRISVSRTVTEAGPVDGLCLYFRTIFDDDIAFDTSPLKPYTPSWPNVVFRLPGQRCTAGDRVTYELDIADINDSRTWSIIRAAIEPAATATEVPASV